MITFSGSKVDRADGRRNDDSWLQAQRLRPDARVLPVRELKLLTADGALRWLSPAELPNGAWQHETSVFLGLDGGAPRFAMDFTARGDAAQGGRYTDLRFAAGFLPSEQAAVAAQARSLIDWHARHRFCAQCGGPTEIKRGGAQRTCINKACSAEHFPRVDPVAIAVVCKGDFCLMGRHKRFPPGMFSALAGFVEVGESLEEAVRREVGEESGVVVGDVRYVMSQPWPFPSSLMIGCLADALTDDLVPDSDELEELRWFSRSDILAALDGEDRGFFMPPPLAIAHHLLKAWVGAA